MNCCRSTTPSPRPRAPAASARQEVQGARPGTPGDAEDRPPPDRRRSPRSARRPAYGRRRPRPRPCSPARPRECRAQALRRESLSPALRIVWPGLRPVGEEGGQALVGQRVLVQLAQHRRRHGGDVGAHLRGLDHVAGGAPRRPAPRSRRRDRRCRSPRCRRSAPCRPAPMSSSRPTKGEMKVAPALAASSACAAEKQSVTLTLMPSSAQRLAGLQPVDGERHLDAMLSASFASAGPRAACPRSRWRSPRR
jgi:hypothetical protein